MESKALALGKQVKAEALNSNVHQIEAIRIINGAWDAPYAHSDRYSPRVIFFLENVSGRYLDE